MNAIQRRWKQGICVFWRIFEQGISVVERQMPDPLPFLLLARSLLRYLERRELEEDQGPGYPTVEPLRIAMQWIRGKMKILAFAAAGGLLVACLAIATGIPGEVSTMSSGLSWFQGDKIHTNTVHRAYFKDLYSRNQAGPGAFPLTLATAPPDSFCSICSCEVSPPFYAPWSDFFANSRRPLEQHVYPTRDSVDLNEFMRQTLLDIYCARQHMTAPQALRLLRRTAGNLGELMSWSLDDLELDRPTIYITTATFPTGKAGAERPQYFRRSGRALRCWMAQQEQEAQAAGWQVIWIVAEDEVEIDPRVVRTLRRTGVPYIYFAYGMTKVWGNAQKNAVLQVVYALSKPGPRGLFRHGPVYGLDDDNKILPDLLDLLIKVQRVGVVPVGNLAGGRWETPVINADTGLVTDSDSPFRRKFAFDYGGYVFNSSLLGTLISGPSFWKHTGFAGETEFLDQIAGSPRDLEPLCGRLAEQECHLVWHNEELTEVEKMTDDEEVEYVRKYGAKKLFAELGFETKKDEVG